jgi:hypothetical protein
MFQYNTLRKHLILKEYGRNIQEMVNNLMLVEDRLSRSQQAKNLVELMKIFLQPTVKDNLDVTHKVWDDLFIISDFKLDVDCPFEKPSAAIVNKRPSPLGYKYYNPIFRHYGRNIELLVKKITEITNPIEKDNAIIYLGRLMKNFYAQYNKDLVEDIVIKEQLERLSRGAISFDLDRIKTENLFESNTKVEKRNLNEGLSNLSGITKRSNNNNRNSKRPMGNGGGLNNNNNKSKSALMNGSSKPNNQNNRRRK